ncbi:MAG: insulinase family protein [Phycisphaerae bacterium]|nr:insulinase family protein [Gemmatimonadaceae bacterium]
MRQLHARVTFALLSAAIVSTACEKPEPPLDRTKPPELGAAAELKLPAMVEKTLPNGLKLVVVEQHEMPVVDVALVVRTGAEADPVGKGGLATLTANMLDEGAGSRDALAIADQVGFLAIDLGTGSGWDQSTISLHSTKATLDSALALMADVALRPTFAEKEFTRLHNDRLTGLLQEQDRGPAIADRAFASIVFGDDNTYGHSVSGSRETIENVVREDVQNFWRTWYVPNNATLVVVGDITVAEAEERANALFGSWAQTSLPTLAAVSAAPPAQASKIYIVDKPNAPQTSFRLGSVGVARSSQDYYPIQVLNTALGGSFTSRLNQNLRETKGYTYGAGSRFSMRREAGPFVASAEVVAEKTDSAMIEFMKELNNIRQPMSAEELEKTKKYLQLGYAENFESTRDIAGAIAGLVPYSLPLNTLSDFQSKIGGITGAEVERTARTYIDPAKMSLVVVGDRKSIEPALKALNIAPIEVRNIGGRPTTIVP